VAFASELWFGVSIAAMSTVVVVGAGPAGSSAAFWLARAGMDVTLVEKKSFPREKTCGDGLTPRAIYELQLMGYNFDFERPGLHRVTGLRSYGGPELKLEMQWPDHSKFPNWGAIIRRRDLDHDVVKLAVAAGAKLHQETTAEPVVEGGRVTHVDLINDGDRERIGADYVVIADGSLSRFGRVLGTSRRRDYPMGLAARGYFDSPNSADPFMESQLYITDATGAAMPGYGWIFPLGDGTVNVGVGLLSTFKRWKDVNTTDMMHAYSNSAPGAWDLTNPTPHRGGK
jgi:geranylgeranyl reductase family protein